MLNVVIIDDEPSVRMGLESIIPWKELGYKVIGSGADGIEGLEKIISLNPDLVLIDMEMPGLHGIDVIKEAQKKNLNFKSIVLTGYSEFKYAKECIKLGVSSYLLKPLDEDELIPMLEEIKQDIAKKNLDNTHIINSKLRNLILGSNITHKLSYYDDCFTTAIKKINIALIKPKSPFKSLQDETILKDYLKQSILKMENLHILTVESNITMIFQNLCYLDMKSYLNKLIEKIKHCKKVEVSCILGKTVNSIYHINKSYEDAKNLYNEKYFFHSKNLLTLEDTLSINLTEKKYEDLDILKINSVLESNLEEEINTLITKLEEFFISSTFTEDRVKGICANELVRLRMKYISENDSYPNIPSNFEIIKDIHNKPTLKDLLSYFKEVFIRISNIHSNKQPTITALDKIIRFIDNNYKDDLKLETLGRIFNYNSSYLGKTFKSYTGEKFTSYLDKIRIDKAKKLLLSSNLKIYEISMEVGFNNIDYFSAKFKKYVGMTPKEYKKGSQIKNL